MKRLLAKALEQAATEMAQLAQGVPNLRRELRIIHITLEMQEKKLEEISANDKGRTTGVPTGRQTNDQWLKLFEYRYVLFLMKLHSIDNYSLLKVLDEENLYMHTSRNRNMQDCLVYFA